ncbi:zinc finger and BTB domain-containing protein 22 [Amia ocellicauda]|uniref:zinc finger and BTB domain-containing protein 22 n=1 Tax=Amia ocellicauda TaxID=2972642 RepID=UPI003464CD49
MSGCSAEGGVWEVQVSFPSVRGAVLAGLNRQRLEGQLCDLAIEVQGQVFHAHRCVLAASSPYFHDQVLLKKVSSVCLPSVLDPGAVESVLSSVYTGRLAMLGADVLSYLTVASVLQLWHIVDKCTELLRGAGGAGAGLVGPRRGRGGGPHPQLNPGCISSSSSGINMNPADSHSHPPGLTAAASSSHRRARPRHGYSFLPPLPPPPGPNPEASDRGCRRKPGSDSRQQSPSSTDCLYSSLECGSEGEWERRGGGREREGGEREGGEAPRRERGSSESDRERGAVVKRERESEEMERRRPPQPSSWPEPWLSSTAHSAPWWPPRAAPRHPHSRRGIYGYGGIYSYSRGATRRGGRFRGRLRAGSLSRPRTPLPPATPAPPPTRPQRERDGEMQPDGGMAEEEEEQEEGMEVKDEERRTDRHTDQYSSTVCDGEREEQGDVTLPEQEDEEVEEEEEEQERDERELMAEGEGEGGGGREGEVEVEVEMGGIGQEEEEEEAKGGGRGGPGSGSSPVFPLPGRAQWQPSPWLQLGGRPEEEDGEEEEEEEDIDEGEVEEMEGVREEEEEEEEEEEGEEEGEGEGEEEYGAVAEGFGCYGSGLAGGTFDEIEDGTGQVSQKPLLPPPPAPAPELPPPDPTWPSATPRRPPQHRRQPPPPHPTPPAPPPPAAPSCPGKLHYCHCGKAYALKSMRDRHVKMQHLNLRPFGCPVCAKTFKMKHHLTKHLKTHSSAATLPAFAPALPSPAPWPPHPPPPELHWLYREGLLRGREAELEEREGEGYFVGALGYQEAEGYFEDSGEAAGLGQIYGQEGGSDGAHHSDAFHVLRTSPAPSDMGRCLGEKSGLHAGGGVKVEELDFDAEAGSVSGGGAGLRSYSGARPGRGGGGGGLVYGLKEEEEEEEESGQRGVYN